MRLTPVGPCWPCALPRSLCTLFQRQPQAPAAAGSLIAQANAALHLCRGDTPVAAPASWTWCLVVEPCGKRAPSSSPAWEAAVPPWCHITAVPLADPDLGNHCRRKLFIYLFIHFKKEEKNPGEFHRPRVACQHRTPELAPLEQGNSQYRLGKGRGK